MLESLINKVAGLKAWNVIIKRLQHRCFPVNIAKVLAIFFKKNFNGWGETFSRLQSHYEETVYILPLSPKEFLVLNLSALEGSKAEST